ncbi:restriction endonuclease [Kitasatospora paracochleata]|uniref:Restriction system protein n=1 Tax=Kitasatospora paracochleata TaxID=58354 RepID=A0ABT1ISA6_9ACTN|nr:restriction endonuclease [Kitasatospora paracochleata]MCP2308004.1 restriction system protein [Kitasatospora paracochleata]
MARRQGSGVLGMLAEAQRQQHRREEAQRRAAAEQQRRYERAQREAQRAAVRGEKEALRAYQQSREADAAARTAELDARVAELRGVLAAGLAGPAFRLTEASARTDVPPFDPGPLGTPVPMPDQGWYQVPPLSGPQAYDPLARRHWDEQAAQARARFEHDWYAAQAAEQERQRRLADYRAQYEAWAAERRRLVGEQSGQTDRLAAELRSGAVDAVVELFETALGWRDDWPEGFPVDVEAAWDAGARQLVVEWELPPYEVVPAVGRYRYVKADDSEAEVARPATERKTVYRDVLAQCALRVLDAVFRADESELLASVVLNGHVAAVDPATGQEQRRCLLSVAVERAAFDSLALDRVAAVDCLVDGLGGRLSARPEKAEPVRTARAARAVAVAPPAGEDEPDLFTMDPIDFEKLIAELFRRRGLDTATTARSGDEGVDVLAEDPDPITGGRIVIQAKRYRHTVPPTAVRDLDATMVRQGANRGILVTTSGFGPGSRRWVEGKPLTLVDGPMLVSLLHEHGLRGRLGAAPAAAADAGRPAPETLAPGQNTPLAAEEVVIAFRSSGAAADLTLLLLGEAGVVRGDRDFVFYHQPSAERDAVVLRPADGSATVRLAALPEDVRRVAVSVNMDTDTGLACDALGEAELELRAGPGAWLFRPPADPAISAMLVAELYRHAGGWKLRAVGQGWADGLAGLARAHGVDVS